jgi:uncharacterized membrane protein YgdD (TMEM256/DUF423 family)
MGRIWVALGALFGLAAVAIAALSAHALPAGSASNAPALLQKAFEMQLAHALALLFCGLWAARAGRLADFAAGAFAAGIVFFCGALDTLAFTGVSLGAAAPIGASLLMAGWALLALSALPRT